LTCKSEEIKFTSTKKEEILSTDSSEKCPQNQAEGSLKRSSIPKSKDEDVDKKVIQLVMHYAEAFEKNWKKISRKVRSLGHRFMTPTLARKIHWKETEPDKYFYRHRFSFREDLILVKLFKIYGTKWSKFTHYFELRNGEMLKNRYYNHIRKRGFFDAFEYLV